LLNRILSHRKTFELVSGDAGVESASQCRRISVGIGCHGFKDRESIASLAYH
jgi:hypothetical protein